MVSGGGIVFIFSFFTYIYRLYVCVGWKIVLFVVLDKSMFECIWKVLLGVISECRVKWVIRFLFVGECFLFDSVEWYYF